MENAWIFLEEKSISALCSFWNGCLFSAAFQEFSVQECHHKASFLITGGPHFVLWFVWVWLNMADLRRRAWNLHSDCTPAFLGKTAHIAEGSWPLCCSRKRHLVALRLSGLRLKFFEKETTELSTSLLHFFYCCHIRNQTWGFTQARHTQPIFI